MRTKPAKNNGSLPLFPPTSNWKAPDLSCLPSWEGQELLSIDTEFRDPTLRKLGCGARRGARIAGYSFAFKDGFSAYIPVRHPEGSVDCEQGMRYARDNAKLFKGKLIGANLPIDVDMFSNEPTGEIDFFHVKEMNDVLVFDPLINELQRGYKLEDVALRRGFEGKDETLLLEAAQCYGADVSKDTWKSIIPDLPARYVGPYGEQDVLLPIKIYFEQLRIAEQEGLTEIFSTESAVTPILLKMRQRGVLIDFDHLDKVDKWAKLEEINTLAKIKHITGYQIPPGKTMTTSACVPAFAAVGIQVPMKRDEKTKKLKYSLDVEFLSTLDHPVARLFRYARQMGKLYSTFCKQVRDFATNGRLHTTFRQIIGANERNEKSGAAFGRLSSAKPNLQQQPSRAKFANFFRQIYIPEPGTRWGCLDFSQQEPRWTTHFAALLNLKGGREAAKAYHEDLLIDNHDFMAKLTGLERLYAKEMFLGKCYGMGGAKLCRKLNLPTRWCVRYKDSGDVQYFETKGQAVKARRDYEGETSFYEAAGEEGQKIIDTFDERAPYIKLLSKRAEQRARETGKITVLGGRVIHFPLGNDGYDWTFKALNRLIQGTSGMQVKLGLIALKREMPDLFVQLQVHDEIDGSFHCTRDMKRAAKILRDAAPALVPWRIDIEEGPSWGELSQVCGVEECEDHILVEEGRPKFYCPEHWKTAA
jgi:DNA polymerase I-like protein with 3'-5' exonuclease and polymerase domains